MPVLDFETGTIKEDKVSGLPLLNFDTGEVSETLLPPAPKATTTRTTTAKEPPEPKPVVKGGAHFYPTTSQVKEFLTAPSQIPPPEAALPTVGLFPTLNLPEGAKIGGPDDGFVISKEGKVLGALEDFMQPAVETAINPALVGVGRALQLGLISPGLGLAGRAIPAIKGRKPGEQFLIKKTAKSQKAPEPSITALKETERQRIVKRLIEKPEKPVAALSPSEEALLIQKRAEAIKQPAKVVPLSLAEQQAMEFQRAGGAEIGAVGQIPGREGQIINVPRLQAMQQQATEYARTMGDKVLDVVPALRTPYRYLSKTESGYQLSQQVHAVERQIGRAGRIAEEQIDRAFEPILGRGIKGVVERIKGRITGQLDQNKIAVGEILEAKRATHPEPNVIQAAAKGRRILNFFADSFDLPRDRRISDYLPHAFRGQYKVSVLGADGKRHAIPGGFAKTERAAYTLAEDYLLNLTPEQRGGATLFIDETFDATRMTDVASSLDAKRFKALKEAIMEDAPREELIQLSGKLAFAPGPKPKVFFGHLMKRTANLEGYEKDAYKILKSYARGAVRKLYWDRELPQIEKLIEELPDYQKPFAKRWVEYLKGDPPLTDKIVDRQLKELGLDLAPGSITRVSSAVRNYFYLTKLWANFSGAVANSYTFLVNAPLKIGPRGMTEGTYLYFRSIWDKGLQNLLRKNLPVKSLRGDVFREPVRGPMHYLDFFDQMEGFTHGATFFGARQKYLREHFKPNLTPVQKRAIERAANEYGRKIDIETQIPQTKSTRGSFFRDPLLGTGFQFKQFMVKESEFFAHLNSKEKAAFVTLTLLYGGPYTIPFVRYFADRDPEVAKAVDYVNDHTNIPRMLGFDFSGDLGVGYVPDDLRSLPGPAGQLVAEGINIVLKGTTGESLSTKEEQFKRLAGRILKPAMIARYEKLQVALTEGVIKDERGRPIIEVAPRDAVQYFLFGSRTEAYTRRIQAHRRFRVLETQERTERQKLIDRYLDAEEKGNEEKKIKVLDAIDKHNEKYGLLVGTEITGKTIKSAQKAREQTLEERIAEGSKKRGEAYRQFVIENP